MGDWQYQVVGGLQGFTSEEYTMQAGDVGLFLVILLLVIG